MRTQLPQILLTIISATYLLSGGVAQAWDQSAMRVDCRFFQDRDHFCYSSAEYRVSGDTIEDIHFGVGCDYETIFDDEATASPQDNVSDSLRPRTAALPRVEITPEGSLRHPGTYTSKLEIASGQITDGVCYVRSADEGDRKLEQYFHWERD